VIGWTPGGVVAQTQTAAETESSGETAKHDDGCSVVLIPHPTEKRRPTGSSWFAQDSSYHVDNNMYALESSDALFSSGEPI